jgi:uncharacterized Tic20 family protein
MKVVVPTRKRLSSWALGCRRNCRPLYKSGEYFLTDSFSATQDSLHSRQNDKIMAAIAHILVIIPFWGLIGASIIWATHKNKSHFVAYQALQAIVYQLLSGLAGVAFGCYTFILTLYLLFPPTPNIRTTEPSAGLILYPSVIGWLVIVAYVVYAIWGGISVLRGHDFRYLIIGTRLEQFLKFREAKNR